MGGEASISLRGGVAAGRLPNLARLLSTSAYGESATTWPVHTAPPPAKNSVQPLPLLGRRYHATHIRGARRNGCSFEEIIEAILHAGVYAGMPAAVEGANIAQGIAQEENNGEA